MSLESLGVGLEGDHHTFTDFPEHTTSKEASGTDTKPPRSQSSKSNKSTVKKSCREHKSVWWKCRSGLALPNLKVSTSLVGGDGSIEQNGVLGNGGSSKGKGLGLEEEEEGFI